MVWGEPGPDGVVVGVLEGTLGANANAWQGAGGSEAWDAPGREPFSSTAVRVTATVRVASDARPSA